MFKVSLGDNPLTGITIFVISISRFAQNNWVMLIGGGVALIFGIKLLARTPGGRSVVDQFKLRLPLFGDLIRKTSISRFARTLGTLVTSGLSILHASNI